MKPFFLNFLGLFLILCVSCQNTSSDKKSDKGTDIGALHISKSNPKQGDSVQLIYNAKDSVYNDFQGYYYVMNSHDIYAYDIDMKREDSLWKGQVFIPDSAMAIAFHFKLDEKDFDNNKAKGFTQALYTKNDSLLPGTLSNIANFYMNMGQTLELNVKMDSVLKMVQKDMAKDSAVNADWMKLYAGLLQIKDQTESENFMKRELSSISQKQTYSEKDFENMIYFSNQLDNKSKADSLIAVGAEEFPTSEFARQRYLQQFRKAKSYPEKEDIFEAYKAKIGRKGEVYDAMLKTLARNALNEKKYDVYKDYLVQLSTPWTIASNFNNAAWKIAEKDSGDLDKAEMLAKIAVSLVSPKKAADNAIHQRTKSQVERTYEYLSGSYCDTYAFVLEKMGKTKEALHQQKRAVEYGKGESLDANERYVELLMTNENYKKAEKEAISFIRENQATKKIEKNYQKAYTKNRGSADGFEESFSKLEEQAQANMEAELSKDMLAKESPDFRLFDKNGSEVKLSDLKGKTIVLDFWATWCGPCRASFPGMQMAVDYYKDDADVQFYFVNTWQREPKGKRHKKVMDFVHKNNYPFEILFDENVNNKFPVVSSFGISGIPTKIIIDANGVWRFTKVGYSGNNDKLFKELKTMIDMLKSRDNETISS